MARPTLTGRTSSLAVVGRVLESTAGSGLGKHRTADAGSTSTRGGLEPWAAPRKLRTACGISRELEHYSEELVFDELCLDLLDDWVADLLAGAAASAAPRPSGRAAERM